MGATVWPELPTWRSMGSQPESQIGREAASSPPSASADGGATWTPQSSGTTSSLSGVSFTDANTGTAVGDGGTILRTNTGGQPPTSGRQP